METWNRAVFLALNAPADPAPGLVLIASILAQYAILLVPLLLAGLWLRGGRADRGGLLLAFCGAEVALGINQAIGLVWYHPRPFAVPVGRTLIAHVADSSFPSDHLTFLVATGVGLLAWTRHRGSGLSVLALALPVAWARLFLGVHFPLDMIGAIPAGCAGLLIVMPFRGWVAATLVPRWAEPLYRRLFAPAIAGGWAQP